MERMFYVITHRVVGELLGEPRVDGPLDGRQLGVGAGVAHADQEQETS